MASVNPRPSIKLLVATSNPHKLDEIRAVFEELAENHISIFTLLSLADLNLALPEPDENEPTFEGNATLKAKYYAKASGHFCLADDSGLEVDALDGEPGVRSARYAGVTGPRHRVDPANNHLLLQRLHNVPAWERTARFVCAMALATPGFVDEKPQTLAIVRGTVEGNIIGPGESPRGDNGFGYDPLFVIKELQKTTAQLTQAQKNAISHRGRASKLMWTHLQDFVAQGKLSAV